MKTITFNQLKTMSMVQIWLDVEDAISTKCLRLTGLHNKLDLLMGNV